MILDVPGAQLYFETRGRGPRLVLIPGANGDGRVFEALRGHLIDRYTVVTYDRRGFSRSILSGAQDYQQRLATDADDVARLIDHVSDDGAIVFGTSSGAIVTLELLTRHPAVARTVLPYEPAAMRLLPDGQEWLDLVFEIYDLYRELGIDPALHAFREQMVGASDRALMAHATSGQANARANAMYWFERELRQYTTVDLDLDSLFSHRDRILPVVGEHSRGYPAYQVGVELAARLHREVTELPGGHAGFATRAAEFARGLHRLIPAEVSS